MNWIILPFRNGVEMTHAAIESMLAQDIETRIVLVNNSELLPLDLMSRLGRRERDGLWCYGTHRGSVASLWNYGVSKAFEQVWCGTENWRDLVVLDHVLVCNNDIELHPSTYRLLLADGGDFVTPVGTLDRPSVMEAAESSFHPESRRPHPDFSCFLIRRKAWETVGPFDERFKVAYCEDGDYHCRMHLAGIDAHSIGVPFYHRVNGTLHNSPPDEQRRIHAAADANRKRFRDKWGFGQGDDDYYRFFEKSVEQLRSEGYSDQGRNAYDPIAMGA